MPSAPHASPPGARTVSRRAVGLGAVAAAGALAGCAGPREAAPRRAAGGSSGTDRDLLRTALAEERAVLAQADEALASLPSLGPRLAATQRVHRAHVDLLAEASGGDDPVPGAEASVPQGAVSQGAVPGPPTGSPAPAPAALLLRLVRAERALVEAHVRAARVADSGTFARVLAGMAASAAQQATVLDRVRRRLPAAASGAG